MIIDLPRFIESERPAWHELEQRLDRIAAEPDKKWPLAETLRFHFLYQKVAADLGRIATFSAEPELRRYLESLVARAYAEVHETRQRGVRWRPWRWFVEEFPAAFRRQSWAFGLALLVTLIGAVFGGFAVALDHEAKSALLPAQFSSLNGDPADRVAKEEGAEEDRLAGSYSSFAGSLMVNNIGVSIKAMALGMTWGIGTLILLLYNGVMVGLIAVDYVMAGQSVFLLGWLLPHGSIELPAVMIGGQAGLVLGRALLGRGNPAPLAQRLRHVGRDVATLIGGVAVFLVWAGIVESFVSQHHEPRLPYWIKISFGLCELVALTWLLTRDWRRSPKKAVP